MSKSQTGDIAVMLSRRKIRVRTGGGTLASEPVVVLRGIHRSHFDLFDCRGTSLGRVVQVGRTDAYEVRDGDDQRVLNLKDLGPSWRILGLTKWRYELSTPDEPEAIRISKVRRLTDTASITQGPGQIGMIRSQVRPRSVGIALRALGSPGRRKSPALTVEDHNSREVARIYIAHKRQPHERVDLIIEVNNGTSEQLRGIAVAASVIADLELIGFAGSSSFGSDAPTP